MLFIEMVAELIFVAIVVKRVNQYTENTLTTIMILITGFLIGISFLAMYIKLLLI